MKFELSSMAWKVGLLMVVVLPLLYVLQFIILIVGMDQQQPLVMLILGAMHVLPSVLTTIGFGLALCLLVRIEHSVRTSQKRD